MKTPVAVTLIILGALLITAPLIADYLHSAQIAAYLTQPNPIIGMVDSERLSELYRFGCWATGSAMVVAAVIFSRRSGTSSEK